MALGQAKPKRERLPIQVAILVHLSHSEQSGSGLRDNCVANGTCHDCFILPIKWITRLEEKNKLVRCEALNGEDCEVARGTGQVGQMSVVGSEAPDMACFYRQAKNCDSRSYSTYLACHHLYLIR